MTLTYPVINRSRRILWLVSGKDKVAALRKLRAADPSVPAGRISQTQALLLATATLPGSRYRTSVGTLRKSSRFLGARETAPHYAT